MMDVTAPAIATPRTDLEIARSVKPRPIVDVARDLGLRDDEIEPYGSVKAITLAASSASAGCRAASTSSLLRSARRRSARASRRPGCWRRASTSAAGGGVHPPARAWDRSSGSRAARPAAGAASHPDGGLQPPPDRRRPRHRGGPQPRGGVHRQPPPPRAHAGIDPLNVLWPRVLDISDRALRKVVVGLGGRENGYPRETEFVITVASEVMAVLALAADLADLGRASAGWSSRQRATAARSRPRTCASPARWPCSCRPIKPNLLQTLEGGPAFVHCGPFANIAHGNNSVLADRIALATNEIVCTEAGFGADMGAEFFDIKCRASGLRPDAAVVVATIRALKMHGGVGKIDDDSRSIRLLEENVGAVTAGGANLAQIENVRLFNVPVVVASTRSRGPAEIEASQTGLAGRRRGRRRRRPLGKGRRRSTISPPVWAAAEEGAP